MFQKFFLKSANLGFSLASNLFVITSDRMSAFKDYWNRRQKINPWERNEKQPWVFKYPEDDDEEANHVITDECIQTNADGQIPLKRVIRVNVPRELWNEDWSFRSALSLPFYVYKIHLRPTVQTTEGTLFTFTKHCNSFKIEKGHQ